MSNKFKCISVGFSFMLLSAFSTGITSETASKEKDRLKTNEPSNEKSWSYEGKTGPEYWDTLHPEYALCGKGNEQSPIDIDLAKVKHDQTLQDIQFNYNPTFFTLQNSDYTIQANDPSGKNSIVVESEKYKLIYMHFHIPSEHTINGKHFEMEVHVVNKNEAGSLAIVGFFIEVGEKNKQLAEIFKSMPAEKTTKDIQLKNKIDLLKLLPSEKNTFRYSGSLTTPPCSEGVQWIVLQQPITISDDQLAAYRNIFHENTNRPTQPLKNREVKSH